MDPNIKSANRALTQILKREDELYHRYSTFFGLSDPAIWVLYTLYEEEDTIYTQNDLVSMWFCPKQTVNYTVNSLCKKGLIELRQLPGARNRKALYLTEEGKHVCDEKIAPLVKAEEISLSRLTEEEQKLLLQLTEKQCIYFEEEIEKITGDKKRKTQ